MKDTPRSRRPRKSTTGSSHRRRGSTAMLPAPVGGSESKAQAGASYKVNIRVRATEGCVDGDTSATPRANERTAISSSFHNADLSWQG